MKKWLMFIVLKAVETLAFLFVPFYVGLALRWTGFFGTSPPSQVWTMWLAGVFGIEIIVVAIALTFAIVFAVTKGVPTLIDKNMEWAKKLSEWL